MSFDDDSDLRQQELTQKEAWRQFQDIFLELIDPSNPESVSLYSFVRRGLYQFHLSGTYDPAFVLNETFLRAYIYIFQKDKRIQNVTGWIKATAFNVIRELNRRKFESLDAIQNWENHYSASIPPDFSSKNEIALVTLAFQKLTPEEQRLLRLVDIENCPYKKVQQSFAEEGIFLSEEALRARKARALKRLREIYHALTASEDCQS